MVQSMLPKVSAADWLQFTSLGYAALDLCFEWDAFNTCSKPIHQWLLSSYIFGFLFRASQIVGNHYADEGKEFLLSMRQQRTLPRILTLMTWFCILPLFIGSSLLGSVWMYEIMWKCPECLPSGSPSWFILLWQAVSYLWIAVYILFGVASWLTERRLSIAEHNLRQVEDGDSLSRWGRISDLVDNDTMGKGKNAGLSPAQIASLPAKTWHCCDEPESGAECSICLCDLDEGDAVRTLPGCNHVFHKACIDLWVVRRADCPLCKRHVGKEITAAPPCTEAVPRRRLAADGVSV